MCSGELSCSLPSLDQLLLFCYLCFQCHEIYTRIALMWRFSCQCHFFWDIFIIFITTISFLLIRSPSLSFFAWVSSLFNGSHVNISMVSYFFYNCIYVQFEFYLQCYYSSLLCYNFIFVGIIPLLIIHFCSIEHRFITWRQGHNIMIHFTVCVWIESRNTGPNIQQPMKEIIWFLNTILNCSFCRITFILFYFIYLFFIEFIGVKFLQPSIQFYNTLFLYYIVCSLPEVTPYSLLSPLSPLFLW